MKHPASMLYLPPDDTPPTTTRDPRIKFLACAHTPTSCPSEGWDPKTGRGPGLRTEALRGPHAQHAHGPTERVPARTAERSSATCSLAHLGWRTSAPFFFLVIPPKALTCSTLSVRPRKGSSGSSAQEPPPKCWGDELPTPVTPTPKPCQGSGKAPPKGHFFPSSQQTPPPPTRRAGKSGARGHTTCFLIQILTLPRQPPPPAPQLPRKIRNWSSGEWTGAPAASQGSNLLGVGAEGRTLTPGPAPPCGVPRQARARSTGNEVFSSKVSKVPKSRTPPLTFSLGMCSVVGGERSCGERTLEGRVRGLERAVGTKVNQGRDRILKKIPNRLSYRRSCFLPF